MRLGGNVGGALHDLDLGFALEHAHLMNDRGGIDDLCGWLEWFAIGLAHQRELPDDLRIELRTAVAKRVIETRRPVENLGQLLIKFRYREGFVGAVIAHCAFDAGAIAVPDFAFGIARPHEQGEFLFA